MSETATPVASPETESKPKPSYIWGVGRRKTACARVRIAVGSGKIEVNGRTINDYFSTESDRKRIFGPLEVTNTGGKMDVWDAPRGVGPYGISGTPQGDIYYVSLAGSFLGKPDLESGETEVIRSETEDAGTRRVWSDSKGRLWVSEWNSGQVSRYDPADGSWKSWPLPGERPKTYAVYVDDRDRVWLTDFGANAILRFEPENERFTAFPSDRANANVRQLLGRPGEVWGAESGTDRLVVIRD